MLDILFLAIDKKQRNRRIMLYKMQDAENLLYPALFLPDNLTPALFTKNIWMLKSNSVLLCMFTLIWKKILFFNINDINFIIARCVLFLIVKMYWIFNTDISRYCDVTLLFAAEKIIQINITFNIGKHKTFK